MSTLRVSISPESKKKLDSFMLGLSGNTNKALCRAINKTLAGVKTDITNEIASQVNLRKTEIQKSTGKKSEQTFLERKATYTEPSGMITTQGANIPLIWYSNVRGTSQKALRTKTVKVQILKSKPAVALISKRPYAQVFIPKLASGHRGLFHKIKGTKRKIKQYYGPKVPGHLLRPKIYDQVQEKANVRIDKNISHEVDFLLSSI